MTFDNPRALSALLLLIPLALLTALHYARRRRILLFFAAAAGPAAAAAIRLRYAASSLAFLAFFALTVTALAGPRWGTRLVPEFRRGVDAALAFDLSRSMDVRDGPGGASRLEQAVSIAGNILAAPGNAGVRFAAAAGKGRGILAVPLTLDAEALPSFLAGISTSRVTGRGTDLESLVDAAAGAFKEESPGKRRVILFSDGEALSGGLDAACERCLARDIAIIAVGVGTEAGGPVPDAAPLPGLDPAAGEAEGRGITSRARSETLREAAARTGGVYIDGNASPPEAAALATEFLSGGGGEGKTAAARTGFRRESASRRPLCVLAALAFFGLSRLFALSRRPSPPRAPAPGRRPRRA